MNSMSTIRNLNALFSRSSWHGSALALTRILKNHEACSDGLHREHVFRGNAPTHVLWKQVSNCDVLARVAIDNVRLEFAAFEKGKEGNVVGAREASEVDDRDRGMALDVCGSLLHDGPGTVVRA